MKKALMKVLRNILRLYRLLIALFWECLRKKLETIPVMSPNFSKLFSKFQTGREKNLKMKCQNFMIIFWKKSSKLRARPKILLKINIQKHSIPWRRKICSMDWILSHFLSSISKESCFYSKMAWKLSPLEQTNKRSKRQKSCFKMILARASYRRETKYAWRKRIPSIEEGLLLIQFIPQLHL